MHTISISALQQNLISYLEKAKEGDGIIVEDENEAIARILPADAKDEEARLIAEGLMRLPKKELTEDFWETNAPEIPLDEIQSETWREILPTEKVRELVKTIIKT